MAKTYTSLVISARKQHLTEISEQSFKYDSTAFQDDCSREKHHVLHYWRLSNSNIKVIALWMTNKIIKIMLNQPKNILFTYSEITIRHVWLKPFLNNHNSLKLLFKERNQDPLMFPLEGSNNLKSNLKLSCEQTWNAYLYLEVVWHREPSACWSWMICFKLHFVFYSEHRRAGMICKYSRQQFATHQQGRVLV